MLTAVFGYVYIELTIENEEVKCLNIKTDSDEEKDEEKSKEELSATSDSTDDIQENISTINF